MDRVVLKETIATFKGVCFFRRHVFEVPLLSDQSYGCFIYSDQNGQVYKYFAAFNSPTWGFIDEILSSRRNKKVDRLMHYLIGMVADVDTPGTHYQNTKHICPVCQSKWVSVNINDSIGAGEYQYLTFDRFENQSEENKIIEIESLLGRYK